MSTRRRAHAHRFAAIGGLGPLGVIGLLTLLVTLGSASQSGFVSDRSALAAQGRSVELSTIQVRGTVGVAGASWNFVSYQSSDGVCMEVEGELSGDQGNVTSCGTPDNPLSWGQGGVTLGNQSYDVAFGLVPPGATGVRLTFRSGTVTSGMTAQGMWASIVPAAAQDANWDLVLIEAVDTSGHATASYQPAALSEYRAAVAALGRAQADPTPIDRGQRVSRSLHVRAAAEPIQQMQALGLGGNQPPPLGPKVPNTPRHPRGVCKSLADVHAVQRAEAVWRAASSSTRLPKRDDSPQAQPSTERARRPLLPTPTACRRHLQSWRQGLRPLGVTSSCANLVYAYKVAAQPEEYLRTAHGS